MMTKGSRILVLVAALALGLVLVLPVWRITLEAPQYPEGLGMVIRINTIEGVKQHDLTNINNLNHYIGMKRIVPESIPELTVMPWIVGLLLVLGVVTAAVGRRRVLYAWTALFLAFAVAGMVDFWKWEYDYGHDLDDEHAIIKIPGMSYQPPLIGARQILNFRAHSWPGSGGWILIVVGALGTGVAVVEFRRGRGAGSDTLDAAVADGGAEASGSSPAGGAPRRPASALMAGTVLAALSVSACSTPSPRPLAYGADTCEGCLMGLADDGHGSELVTRTGKVHTFDSIECMAAYLRTTDDPARVHSTWVTDFSNPGELVDAREAFFLVSPTLQSPMGLGLTAFARKEDRDGAVHSFGGEPLDWEGVRALVDARWPGGWPAHGGHTEFMAPQGGSTAHQGHGG